MFDKRNPKSDPPRSKIDKKIIPTELKKINSFGLWDWRLNPKKTQWTKVPVNKFGQRIDVADFKMTFKQIMKDWKKSGMAGIGFYFSPGNNILGLDLDDCVEDGVINSYAQNILDKVKSYWEKSVSGTGIHVIGSGADLINGVDDKIVFHKSRFFTISTIGQGKLKNIGKKVNKLFAKKTSKKGKTKQGTAEITEIYNIVKDISPSLPEPEWFDVCKAIHNKSGGTDSGFRLFLGWSAGDYCDKAYHTEDFDETECEKRWARCKTDKENSVGFPRLQEIKTRNSIEIEKIDFSKFTTKEKQDLITPSIHKRWLTPDLFPTKCGFPEAAKEMARFNKVDFDPIISTMMVVTCASINKKVKIVERGGLTHNASIGLLIGSPSGARKSSMDRPVIQPFKDHEATVIGQWKKDLYRNRAKEKQLKGQIKGCQAELMEDPDNEKLFNFVISLEQQLAECRLKMPKMIESDVTEEKLSESMAANSETMLVQSDDARNVISNIVGRYDASSEGIYICGLTGDTYRRSRIKNDVDIVLDEPCINMSLKVQLDKMEQFVAAKQMAQSGLVARMFMKVIDVDLKNQMQVLESDKDLDLAAVRGYNDTITRLLEYEGPRITVEMSDAARAEYSRTTVEFSQHVGEGGKWSAWGDVTNKVISSTVKMALIMKIMDEPDLLDGLGSKMMLHCLEISKKNLKMAAAIVEIMTDQTVEVMTGLQVGREIDGARVLYQKLKKDNEDLGTISWTFTDIRNKYSVSGRENLDRYIGVLVEQGILEKEDNFSYCFA